MSFVTLTKEEFEGLLPVFTIVDGLRAKEYVYDIASSRDEISVRIYSTVDMSTNQTRDKGDDAIRIVFWDRLNNRPIGKGSKILRVEGKTTIQERIKQRIDDFLDKVHDQKIVDFNYVRFILENSTGSFADSLLDGLNKFKSLTDKQLVYILGEYNPRGKSTFEKQLKNKYPNYLDMYLDSQKGNEEESENGQERKEDERQETKREAVEETSQKYLFQPPKEEKEVPIILTSQYEPYQYPFEKFNPVQSETFQYKNDNNNMVISANTSAGKTICAELLIDNTLNRGKKVIYLSPLKSLTQEKYEDWSKRYKDQEITILTGDYTLSKEMSKKLSKSDIIVMTSEMMDSRTRKMKLEKNYWMRQVGLVIVDESHIITTNRGHAVETGIIRFCNINPLARILFLSATMPNVKELADWLTALNGKYTEVIYNTWRPVELQYLFYEYREAKTSRGYTDYYGTQQNKRELAIKAIMSKPDEKFLVFCHDKTTGRAIVNMLEEHGEKVCFHNADLDLKERLEIEKSFQDRTNGLRVLVSTSTLAWGRNLPARNVVIVGIHRGLSEVDSLDIIQMAGRAGRYGIDDQGFVHMIIPEGHQPMWEYKLKNPRPVLSVLNDEQVLAFHVLAEIYNKEITSERTLIDWYEKSLAYRQNVKPFTVDVAKDLLQRLSDMEMVRYSGINPFITDLGKVSAWLYFSPYDVYAWYKNFTSIFSNGRMQSREEDLAISWAIGDIPNNNLGYVPRDINGLCDKYKDMLKQMNIICSDAVPNVIALHRLLCGDTKVIGLLKAIQRNCIFDIQRVMQAISMIDSMYAKWERSELWTILPDRIKYGIPAELVELTRLPGIGGKRARRMWEKGIKTIADVADKKNKKDLAMVLTPPLALKIQKEAQELISNN